MAVTPSEPSRLTSYIFTLGVEGNDAASALRRSLQTAAAACPPHPNRGTRALSALSANHTQIATLSYWLALHGRQPAERRLARLHAQRWHENIGQI